MGRSPSVWQMVAIRSPWALLSSFALLFCHSRNMKLDFQNASKPLIYGARLLEGFEPELKWHHAHNHEDISRILIFKSTGKPLRTRYLQKNGTYRHFLLPYVPQPPKWKCRSVMRGYIGWFSVPDVPLSRKIGTWRKDFCCICPQAQNLGEKSRKMGHRDKIFHLYVPVREYVYFSIGILFMVLRMYGAGAGQI